MKRDLQSILDQWLASPRRKPLVLRGARQVGKTWFARDLAIRSGRTLVEANFERNPELARYFASPDPRIVFDELTIALDIEAAPERSILFLDEIQGAPEIIAKLRWFAEEFPELPVLAAGSLLEFALKDFGHSMPVGRIHFMVVEPMSFPEYLAAHGQERLLKHLEAWHPEQTISPAVHDKASEWFDRYAMVGGMPEIVNADRQEGNAGECRRLQRDLFQSYRDDFAKYAGRMEPRLIHDVLLATVGSLGNKFVFSKVGNGVKHRQARRALELLSMARLCRIILHSSASGLPLAAQAKRRSLKAALLDVGLAHGLWSTPARRSFPSWDSVSPEIRGAVAEQLAAQQLSIACAPPGQSAELFHWRREGGRAGEIDFLVEISTRIVPVEIKSGAIGAMKSLHQFMYEKSLDFAVRLDRNPPSLQHVEVKTTTGQPVAYDLLNLPHYLAWRLEVLIERSE